MSTPITGATGWQTKPEDALHSIRTPWAIRWGFYPVAFATTLTYIALETRGHFGSLGSAYPLYLGTLITLMVLLERLHPLRREWGMTRNNFLIRDLPMLVVNGTAIALTSQLIKWFSAHVEAQPLVSLAMPWWAQALLLLAVFDFMWYWFHRISHEGTGVVGKWLWKVHVLHHLPGEVYVLCTPLVIH